MGEAKYEDAKELNITDGVYRRAPLVNITLRLSGNVCALAF